jgi:acyl-CoA synthetase (AMP-forming)/AMP-acid ligase II
MRADERYRSIPGILRENATRFADCEAVVDGEQRLTYSDLAEYAMRATRAVMSAGVQPGDRVSIWAPNSVEFIVAALGVLGAGAWLVPINTRFKGDEAAYVLRKSGARALFTVSGFLGIDYVELLRAADADLADSCRTVLLSGESEREVEPFDDFLAAGDAVDEDAACARVDAIDGDDVSDIMFTSGTTGRPKGVLLTHAQSLRAFEAWGSRFGIRDGDRDLIVPPFFHCFGYKAGWMLCLMSGATALPVATFEPGEALRAIERERVSVVTGPPTLWSAILDHPDMPTTDLSSIRLAFVGAAPAAGALIHRMLAELPVEHVSTGYGLTESTAMCSITKPSDPPDVISAWSAGTPVDGVEVRVIDDAGDDVVAGTPGELLIRGFNVMRGYYDDPEATAEVIEPDGWLHTGDVAVASDDGHLRIVDRKKDIYIVGGFNVSPAEVEGHLLRDERIGEVAVIGIPDERMGEVGAAFVVPRPGQSIAPEDVIAFAREHVANYKVPRRVEIVDALPLNASGKVLKNVLRERCAADSTA